MKKFTAGERRGMILLLIALAIIIAGSLIFSRPAPDNAAATTSDSVSVEMQQALVSDTAAKKVKKKKTKKKKDNKTKTYPTRDPLDERLPMENNN